MCQCNNKPDNRCNCDTWLRLEVGKTYITDSKNNSQRVKILAETSQGRFVGEWVITHGISEFLPNGAPRWFGDAVLVKEYKEPVVHERFFLWLKNKHNGLISTGTYSLENVPGQIHGHDILKCDRVTYTEV